MNGQDRPMVSFSISLMVTKGAIELSGGPDEKREREREREREGRERERERERH